MRFLSSFSLLALSSVFCLASLNRVDAEDAVAGSYLFQVFLLDDTDYSESRMTAPAVELKFENNGEVYSIQAQSYSLGSLFSYEGSPRLTFFKEVIGADGEIIRQPLTRVDLGQAGRRIIFIRKKKSGRFASSVIRVDADLLKENHLRIQNLSNQAVHVKVANRFETLASLQGHDFSIDIEDGPPLVELTMGAVDGQKAYRIEKKKYVFRQGNRKMILLYNDASQRDRVDYSSIFVRNIPEKVVNVSDEKVLQEDISGYYTGEDSGEGEGPDGP